MKSLPIAVLATAVAATATPAAPPAHAAGGVQRCSGTGEAPVYTDSSCAALGGTAVPLPAALERRIAIDAAAFPAARPDAPRAAAIAIVPRSRHGGCARTTTQLRMDLQSSLATGDVNRLAESYHWVGQSQAQAGSLMRHLERMAEHAPRQSRFFDARIGAGDLQLAGGAHPTQDVGILQLTLGEDDAGEVVDLRVLRYSGCYFVRL
jgi:hypothetical protein